MYCKEINYLVETYETDEVIAEGEAVIDNYKQLVRMTATCYSEALRGEALRCGSVYNVPRLKRIFIEGIHPSTFFSINTYGEPQKNATLHNLSRHATLLV